MIRFIRQFSKPILWAVVVIVVVSFSFWGSFSMREGGYATGGTQRIGSLGGRPLTQAEFAAAQKQAYQALSLSQGQAIQLDERTQQMLNEETWRGLLLREEAARRGIRVSDADVVAAVQRFPAFQNTNGQFEGVRLQQFITAALPSVGMNQVAFQNMLRDQIAVERVVSQLTAGVRVSEAEIQDQAARLFARTVVETIEFKNADFVKDAKVSDEDIKKEYDAGAGNYSTPERRKVSFVRFRLPADQQSLTNAARSTALNSLYDKAGAFATTAAGEPGKPAPAFDELARAQGLTVETTPFFCADEPVTGVTESNAFMAAAYSLGTTRPVGDVIQGRDEFYVQRLAEVQPSQRLPLDQVRARIVATLSEEQAASLADKAAADALAKLEEAQRAGKPFDATAAELKLTVKRVDPFVPADTTAEDSAATRILRSISMDVPTGGLSAVQPTRDGSIIVHVVSRELKDADPDKLRRLRQRIVEQRRSVQLREWFAAQMRDPGNAINLGPAPARQAGAVPAAPQG